MGGCCYSCLKYMVMIFNLVYMLLGLFLQGSMLWIYFDDNLIGPVAKDVEGYNWVIFVLMGIGTIMTIMGFLGCCGALQESQCMLATFFALVLVLLAGQVAACVWIYGNTEEFKSVTISSFRHAFQEYYGNKNYSDKTEAMDILQRELECCGASGSEDWREAKYNQKENPSGVIDIGISSTLGSYVIPKTCCEKTLNAEACDAVRQVNVVGNLLENIHKEGCAKKILDIIEANSWIVFIVILTIFLIEILAMIFSMMLCCTARRIDEYKS